MCATQKEFILLAVVLCSLSFTSGQISFLSCGRRTAKTAFLIHHGSNATVEHWPWHVAIYHEDKYKCGGSIIDGDTILTAAHCVYKEHGVISKTLVSVHVGRANLSETIDDKQIHDAKELIVHPEFNSTSVIHDIALIKLTTNITMSKSVKPVCLWTMDSEQSLIVGKNGTIVGFGFNERDVVSDQLKQALIEVVHPFSCIQMDRDVFGTHLTWDMFCGIGKANVSACNGDSGGGMVFEVRGKWFVRGLVSFATVRGNKTLKLCDPGKPTVYTDVAKYLEWIKPHIDQRILPYESNVLDIDYEEKLRLFNFNICGAKTFTYMMLYRTWTLPWLGFVFDGEDIAPWCVITLISEWYAVGSASCSNIIRDNFFIRLGGYVDTPYRNCYDHYGATRCSHPTQTRLIKNVIIHPGYNRNNYTHNIALIELMTPADITQPNVKPICMPVTSSLRTNATTNLHMAVVQKKKLKNTKKTFEVIENILVRYVEPTECQRRFAQGGFVPNLGNNQLCAEKVNYEEIKNCISTLRGTSLQEMKLLNGTERYFLRSLDLFGSTCNAKNTTIYLDTEPYLDWMLYNMKYHTKETTDADSKLETEWDMWQQQPGKEKLRLFKMNTCGITSTVIQRKDHVPWNGVLFDDEHSSRDEIGVVLINEWYTLAPKLAMQMNRVWRFVRLGENDEERNYKDEEEKDVKVQNQLVEIKSIIIPPPEHPKQSVALIELLEPANLQIPSIRPICLPFMEGLQKLKPKELLLSTIQLHFTYSRPTTNINLTVLDRPTCQDRLLWSGVTLLAANSTCEADTNIQQNDGGGMAFLSMSLAFFLSNFHFRDNQRYFLHGMIVNQDYQIDYQSLGVYLFDTIELADLDWILENVLEKVQQTSFLSTATNERVDLKSVQVPSSIRPLMNMDTCGMSSSCYSTPWIGDAEKCLVTLISERFAVGPAHCFTDYAGLEVVFGGSRDTSEKACLKSNDSEPVTQRIKIEFAFIHPHHTKENNANDIALLLLASPVNTSFPNVKPICLPIIDEIRSYDTSNLIMVWQGFSEETVDDRYVNVVECRKRWKGLNPNITIDSSNHCVILKRKSEEDCYHIRYGASLHSRQRLESGERNFLRGILLTKNTYCSLYYPMVYTNTDTYLNWMLEVIANNILNPLSHYDGLD